LVVQLGWVLSILIRGCQLSTGASENGNMQSN
jgi:hypothetical protein